MPSKTQITIDDIRSAQRKIAPYIVKTPIVTSALLNRWLGHTVYFKAECLQRVGAFKARGACNTLSWLIEQQGKPPKVICNSSGNHAQAVAWSASLWDIPAVIYTYKSASKVKIQAAISYGAQIVYGESRAEVDELTATAAQQEGTVWIPPFNHNQVIAGQGTAVYEALEEIGAVDAVFAPCGGGGLLSGSLISTRSLAPKAQVIGAEPLSANDAARSLQCGSIQRLAAPPVTLADGATTLSVGDITFQYLQQLDDFFEVEETAIAYWTQWLTHLLKLHVEPTSAMSMDAVMRWLKPKHQPQSVLVVLSGGNIDCNSMSRIWAQDHLTTPPNEN